MGVRAITTYLLRRMAYLRAPPLPPPPPPPSLKTSPGTPVSPAGSAAVSRGSSRTRLTPPISPTDEHDPPPFRARPDDRVSLSQVFEPRDAVPPIEDIVEALERPHLYRRSTSSMHHDYSQSLHRELSSANRGRDRPEAIRSPHSTNKIADPTLFNLSFADASRYPIDYHEDERSEEGEVAPARHGSHSGVRPSKRLDHRDEAMAVFEGFRPLARAHTHSGMVVPTEIRLRRASSKDTSGFDRRPSSASTVRPNNVQLPVPVRNSSENHLQSPNMPSKGTVAGPAITHAYVHQFVAEASGHDEPIDRKRKKSATLQVVRSRDSVYEIIWEDEDAFESSTAPEAGSSTPESSEASTPTLEDTSAGTTLLQGPARSQRGPPLKINTKLRQWSWAGELGPCSTLPSTRRSSQFTPRPESPVTATAPSLQPSRTHSAEPPSTSSEHTIILAPITQDMSPQAVSEPAWSPERVEPPTPTEPEPIPRRRSSIKPAGSPFLGGYALTSKKRRELLGKRKASNLPPEEERFSTHRDSLVLAHKRIFQEDVDKAVGHVGDHFAHDPTIMHRKEGEGYEGSAEESSDSGEGSRINKLRRDTWHRPVPRPLTPPASGPPSPRAEREFDLAIPTHEPKSPAIPEHPPSSTSRDSPASSSWPPQQIREKGRAPAGRIVSTPKGILRPSVTRTPSSNRVHVAAEHTTVGCDREVGRQKSKERREKAKSDEWYGKDF